MFAIYCCIYFVVRNNHVVALWIRACTCVHMRVYACLYVSVYVRVLRSLC